MNEEQLEEVLDMAESLIRFLINQKVDVQRLAALQQASPDGRIPDAERQSFIADFRSAIGRPV